MTAQSDTTRGHAGTPANRAARLGVTRLLMAVGTVGVLTAVVKLGATGKELLIADRFGTGDAIDAFLIAYAVPQFLVGMLALAIPSALIPVLAHLRRAACEQAAREFTGTIILGAIIVLLVATGLVALAIPALIPLLASGFDQAKLELARSLCWLLLPVVALAGLNAVYGAVLNSRERFAAAALVPLATPLCVGVSVLLFAEPWGAWCLGAGIIAGATIETVSLALTLRAGGLPVLPRWHGWTPAMSRFTREYVPLVGGSVLMTSTMLVDTAMAAQLEPGSVATLNYGTRVLWLVLGIAGVAVGTGVLPQFSELVAACDWDGVQRTLLVVAKLLLVLTVPLTIALIAASHTIVTILFEHGAFGRESTELVAEVQALYLLQIPFFILGMLGVRLLSALQRSRIISAVAAINVVINVLGNWILMQWLGVAGIALSTSIVYLVSTTLVMVAVARALARARAEAEPTQAPKLHRPDTP